MIPAGYHGQYQNSFKNLKAEHIGLETAGIDNFITIDGNKKDKHHLPECAYR
jgi:hypothetical protein